MGPKRPSRGAKASSSREGRARKRAGSHEPTEEYIEAREALQGRLLECTDIEADMERQAEEILAQNPRLRKFQNVWGTYGWNSKYKKATGGRSAGNLPKANATQDKNQTVPRPELNTASQVLQNGVSGAAPPLAGSAYLTEGMPKQCEGQADGGHRPGGAMHPDTSSTVPVAGIEGMQNAIPREAVQMSQTYGIVDLSELRQSHKDWLMSADVYREVGDMLERLARHMELQAKMQEMQAQQLQTLLDNSQQINLAMRQLPSASLRENSNQAAPPELPLPARPLQPATAGCQIPASQASGQTIVGLNGQVPFLKSFPSLVEFWKMWETGSRKDNVRPLKLYDSRENRPENFKRQRFYELAKLANHIHKKAAEQSKQPMQVAEELDRERKSLNKTVASYTRHIIR